MFYSSRSDSSGWYGTNYDDEVIAKRLPNGNLQVGKVCYAPTATPAPIKTPKSRRTWTYDYAWGGWNYGDRNRAGTCDYTWGGYYGDDYDDDSDDDGYYDRTRTGTYDYTWAIRNVVQKAHSNSAKIKNDDGDWTVVKSRQNSSDDDDDRDCDCDCDYDYDEIIFWKAHWAEQDDADAANTLSVNQAEIAAYEPRQNSAEAHTRHCSTPAIQKTRRTVASLCQQRVADKMRSPKDKSRHTLLASKMKDALSRYEKLVAKNDDSHGTFLRLNKMIGEMNKLVKKAGKK